MAERIRVDPYGFVSLAGEPERLAPTPHHRFEGASGRLLCTLTTKTPLFVYDPRFARSAGGGHEEARFPVRPDGSAFIPGSSLKGVIRSVVEAVEPSCFRFFSNVYRGKGATAGLSLEARLPRGFEHCQDHSRLCPACRLFGSVYRDQVVHAGKVTVSDAVAPPGSYEIQPKIILDVLSTPKPEGRPDTYVLRERGNEVRGRKFYRHRLDGVLTRAGGRRDNQNKTVWPVAPDSVFTFEVGYSDLHESELRVLLYALALEPGLWHKVGMGKSIGMGSVHIQIVQWQRIDRSTRYRYLGGGVSAPLDREALAKQLAVWLRPYRESDAPNLQDLRELWRYDHGYDVRYALPSSG
ncbi:MAG: RAMP superfamily CRISPR-associated protein [Bacillota bacterium]